MWLIGCCCHLLRVVIVALLYESPGGNQVDGLPPAQHLVLLAPIGLSPGCLRAISILDLLSVKRQPCLHRGLFLQDNFCSGLVSFSVGPLFFQENIWCALTKDQCAPNIFLKKQRARKRRTSPKQPEESKERHEKQPKTTQNVNRHRPLGIRIVSHWGQKHQIWSNSITTKMIVLPSAPSPHSAVRGVS